MCHWVKCCVKIKRLTCCAIGNLCCAALELSKKKNWPSVLMSMKQDMCPKNYLKTFEKQRIVFHLLL